MDNSPMREKWLEQGYKDFAINGPGKLSINSISKTIGTSRSSFYHYFVDLDYFIEMLLEKHFSYAQQFNETAKTKCSALYPDLYQLLSQYTTPLMFNLQLFRNRSDPRFNFMFLKLYELTAESFALELFAEQFSISSKNKELYKAWLTMGEAWYSRLNLQDLSYETLQKHSEDVMGPVLKLLKSPLYSLWQEK